MTIAQLETKKNHVVKVIFNPHDQRFPMIGKFVDLKDGKELSSKGMIRFVNQSKLQFWKDQEPAVALTKIYCVSDFSQVISITIN